MGFSVRNPTPSDEEDLTEDHLSDLEDMSVDESDGSSLDEFIVPSDDESEVTTPESIPNKCRTKKEPSVDLSNIVPGKRKRKEPEKFNIDPNEYEKLFLAGADKEELDRTAEVDLDLMEDIQSTTESFVPDSEDDYVSGEEETDFSENSDEESEEDDELDQEDLDEDSDHDENFVETGPIRCVSRKKY